MGAERADCDTEQVKRGLIGGHVQRKPRPSLLYPITFLAALLLGLMGLVLPGPAYPDFSSAPSDDAKGAALVVSVACIAAAVLTSLLADRQRLLFWLAIILLGLGCFDLVKNLLLDTYEQGLRNG